MDIKYNVFTVLNSVYMKYFGKIFINSMYDKVDIDKIETIFIGDTGLSKEDRSYLSNYEKVESNINDSNEDFSIWGGKWHNSVTQKTILFKSLVEYSKIPTLMLDADLLFLKDINSLINTDYDIQICFRNHERRERKHPMDYLASYVSANSPNCLSFMDKWIELIDKSETVNINGNLIKAKETPCLCKAVEIFREDLKIGDVDEDIVSVYDAPNILPDISRIIHFKGWGPYSYAKNMDDAFYGKIVSRGWGDYVKRYLDV